MHFRRFIKFFSKFFTTIKTTKIHFFLKILTFSSSLSIFIVPSKFFLCEFFTPFENGILRQNYIFFLNSRQFIIFFKLLLNFHRFIIWFLYYTYSSQWPKTTFFNKNTLFFINIQQFHQFFNFDQRFHQSFFFLQILDNKELIFNFIRERKRERERT